MAPTEILDLIASPVGRVMLVAWAVNAIVRLLKEDVRWLPTVKAGNRRLLAAALGLVAGAIDAVASGVSWSSAFVAIGSPLLAIIAHHVIVDGALRGRDLPIPAWLRAPKVEAETVTRIVGGLIVFAVLLCSGCSASTADRQLCYAQAEAATIAAAHQRCPGAWESCSERPAILAELQAAQEACP